MIDHSLNTSRGCNLRINALFETPPEEIGRTDIALLNLLCALELPGSEALEVFKCMKRLDHLTEFIKVNVERTFHTTGPSPQYAYSEAQTRMAALVMHMKRDYGAAYSPSAKADLDAGINTPFSDASEVFIHGLLRDDRHQRWGTCSSLPVLTVCLARRMGYPVSLVVTRKHVYARWEGSGESFNIEVSNPEGMTVQSDDHYRTVSHSLNVEDEQSGFYLRSLSSAEEFGLFLRLRVQCLLDAARYDEALLWAVRALQFSPEEPRFPDGAYFILGTALKHRLRAKNPVCRIPPSDDPNPFDCEAGDLLKLEERSLFLTIKAHYHEKQGKIEQARQEYEDACRQNVFGGNEQRDLQRFLRKHQLRRKIGPLLPPTNLGRPRAFQLKCRPEQEAQILAKLADKFERSGEFVKARDALQELYTFDPCNAKMFQRARAIEKQPEFQAQFKKLYEERRRALQLRKARHQAPIAMPRGIMISGIALANEKE